MARQQARYFPFALVAVQRPLAKANHQGNADDDGRDQNGAAKISQRISRAGLKVSDTGRIGLHFVKAIGALPEKRHAWSRFLENGYCTRVQVPLAIPVSNC